MEATIKEVIAEQMSVPVESLTADTTFTSLKADPIDMMDLIMHLENVLDIAITEEPSFKTVGQLIASVSVA